MIFFKSIKKILITILALYMVLLSVLFLTTNGDFFPIVALLGLFATLPWFLLLGASNMILWKRVIELEEKNDKAQ